MQSSRTEFRQLFRESQPWTIIFDLYGIIFSAMYALSICFVDDWHFVNCSSYQTGIYMLGERLVEACLIGAYVLCVIAITPLKCTGCSCCCDFLWLITYWVLVPPLLIFAIDGSMLEIIEVFVFGSLALISIATSPPTATKDHTILSLYSNKITVIFWEGWYYLTLAVIGMFKGKTTSCSGVMSLFAVLLVCYIHHVFHKNILRSVDFVRSILTRRQQNRDAQGQNRDQPPVVLQNVTTVSDEPTANQPPAYNEVISGK